MSTAVEAFRWLEELTYNCEFFADPKHLRNVQHELGFLWWRRRDHPNKAENLLEGFVEHANELIAACNQLRVIIAEEVKIDGR